MLSTPIEACGQPLVYIALCKSSQITVQLRAMSKSVARPLSDALVRKK